MSVCFRANNESKCCIHLASLAWLIVHKTTSFSYVSISDCDIVSAVILRHETILWFHAYHVDFLPLPTDADTVSHPIINPYKKHWYWTMTKWFICALVRAFFYWLSKVFCGPFLLFMFCVCHAVLFVHCSLVATCWERAGLFTLLYVMFFLCYTHFPRCCPQSGLVLDCIDSWFLPSSYLYIQVHYKSYFTTQYFTSFFHIFIH